MGLVGRRPQASLLPVEREARRVVRLAAGCPAVGVEEAGAVRVTSKVCLWRYFSRRLPDLAILLMDLQVVCPDHRLDPRAECRLTAHREGLVTQCPDPGRQPTTRM